MVKDDETTGKELATTINQLDPTILISGTTMLKGRHLLGWTRWEQCNVSLFVLRIVLSVWNGHRITLAVRSRT